MGVCERILLSPLTNLVKLIQDYEENKNIF
jgi:hypothetical protein